jgi:cell division protein FtsB
MLKFNKKKNQYHFWYSPISLGILFCVLVIFSYNLFGLLEKERDTAKKKELILDQIDQYQKREDSLSSDIAKLKTETGIEDIIREKYQVVKPGENMVVILDSPNKDSKTEGAPQRYSLWERFKRIFKN